MFLQNIFESYHHDEKPFADLYTTGIYLISWHQFGIHCVNQFVPCLTNLSDRSNVETF